MANDQRKKPSTKRDLLDRNGMKNYRERQWLQSIGNITEGPIVDKLVSVFRQLEEIGVKQCRH